MEIQGATTSQTRIAELSRQLERVTGQFALDTSAADPSNVRLRVYRINDRIQQVAAQFTDLHVKIVSDRSLKD